MSNLRSSSDQASLQSLTRTEGTQTRSSLSIKSLERFTLYITKCLPYLTIKYL